MFIYSEPPIECDDCLEKSNRLDDVKYWLRAILDQIYGLEEFDESKLENYLDELSGYLNMKLPVRDLVISRKQNKQDRITYLDDWKQFNNNFLTAISKGA
jgi:hypothetical protein